MKRGCFALAVCILSAAGSTFAAVTNPINTGSISIQLSPFAIIPSADGAPQDLVSANDGTGRLFVTTRNGKIDILNANGSSGGTFLNLAGAPGISFYNGGEGGFSGLAFSPTYATDGKFYTFDTENYSASKPADIGFSSPEIAPATPSVLPNNQISIRQWTVSGNANVADTSSTELLRINHPEDNHQGGSLRIGPDGNLYIGLGDGGGGNDFNGNVNSATDGHNNAIGNGQDTTVPFGKILRINPNGTNSTNGKYGIPTDNPFASGAGGNLKEIYAYGFRNPYRFNFDSATGKLWVGDVGQSSREEVDVVDSTSIANGPNFGWPFREGSVAGGSGRSIPVGFSSLDPLGEYTHGDGIAIIGGIVYHGTKIPTLDGKYVFGDLEGANGRLFYMDTTSGAISEFGYLTSTHPTSNLYGFGQDQNGELYAIFSNGNVLALVPEPSSLTLALLAVPAWLLWRKRNAGT